MALWSLSVSDFVSSFVTSRFDQHWRGLLFFATPEWSLRVDSSSAIFQSARRLWPLKFGDHLDGLRRETPPRMCNARPARYQQLPSGKLLTRQHFSAYSYHGTVLSLNTKQRCIMLRALKPNHTTFSPRNLCTRVAESSVHELASIFARTFRPISWRLITPLDIDIADRNTVIPQFPSLPTFGRSSLIKKPTEFILKTI